MRAERALLGPRAAPAAPPRATARARRRRVRPRRAPPTRLAASAAWRVVERRRSSCDDGKASQDARPARCRAPRRRSRFTSECRPTAPERVAAALRRADEEADRVVGLVGGRDRRSTRSTSAIATDSAIAGRGLSVNERAAAGGPIIRLKISSVPTTGTVIVVASASTARKESSIAEGARPRAPRRPPPAPRRASAAGRGARRRARRRSAERGRRHELVGADPEHLAEEQRVDLGRVLGAQAEEERTEPEHHDERQRRHHVVAAAPAEQPIPSAPEQREDAEPEERADADQARPGGAGEGAVGDRVRDERRAAQDR